MRDLRFLFALGALLLAVALTANAYADHVGAGDSPNARLGLTVDL